AHVLDFDLRFVDTVFLHEGLPLGEGAVGGRSAEHAALEILRLDNPGLGGRADREGRLVVDHQHGLDFVVRILVAELDQRVDVEKTDWISAGGDAGDAGNRAGARVDGDVKSFRLVVAFVDRDEVGGGR